MLSWHVKFEGCYFVLANVKFNSVDDLRYKRVGMEYDVSFKVHLQINSSFLGSI